MDKNTLIGLLLMAGIIFGFMWLNQPSEEEIAAARAKQEQVLAEQEREAIAKAQEAARPDSVSADERNAVVSTIKKIGVADSAGVVRYSTEEVNLVVSGDAISGTVAAADTVIGIERLMNNEFGDDFTLTQSKAAVKNLRTVLNNAARFQDFARHMGGTEQTVTLQNDVLELTLSSKGGRIADAMLKDYFSYMGGDTTNIHVFRPEHANYNFTFTTASQQRFGTDQFYFTPVQENDSTVLMKLDFANGGYWGIRYTLPAGSYVARMEIVQSKMDAYLPSNMATMDFNVAQNIIRTEEGRTFEERQSAIYYKYVGDSPDDLESMSDDNESLNQSVKWIAFKSQFFSTVFIPQTKFSAAELKSHVVKSHPEILKVFNASTVLDYSTGSQNPIAIDIYFGPNLYPLLSDLGEQLAGEDGEDLELTELVPLGWPIIRWISTLIIIPVFHFLGGFITNYGLIILLLTIFIKIIVFPFTYKSFMSQAKMRVLAPEIKEINEKYPGQENAMKRSQKTMELYSRAGASPMSGCLPMLLQMPVLIAMFWFFPSCIELRGQSFLWATNLAAPDVVFTLPFSIPWYGDKVSLFCLLMTVTNVIYTRINMQNQPGGDSMPMMKWMMYLMPVMFLFFFNDYASGLSYYYFLSLLITIAQTWIFRRCINEEKVRAEMLENAKKPKKKNGWLARLEEAQRQQQALLREQQGKKGKKK